MNVLFRTDASGSLGTGHLARCLVLADAIARCGGTCHFLVRNRNAVADRLLNDSPHSVFSLDLPDACDSMEDVQRCIHYVQGMSSMVDWLVVDHYGLDAQWEGVARKMSPSLLVIDDLANRPHDCDVLVDPGPSRQAVEYARWLRDERTHLLLGPQYALLKPSFATHHDTAPLWPEVRRAHVFFGGGSAVGWLPACVAMLMDAEPALEVFAVGFCNEQAMLRLGERHGKRLTWSRHEADMVQHYARCSVAIGSPGTATWERACIGLPSALMATAQNQVPILEQLDQQGLCRYLGPAWQWDTPLLASRIHAFLQDDASRASMRALGVSAVDGRGVERIVQRLHARGEVDA